MNPADLIHDLTYISYAHNRRLSPDISPARWAKVYGPAVWDMEDQFLAEQSTIAEERSAPHPR